MADEGGAVAPAAWDLSQRNGDAHMADEKLEAALRKRLGKLEAAHLKKKEKARKIYNDPKRKKNKKKKLRKPEAIRAKTLSLKSKKLGDDGVRVVFDFSDYVADVIKLDLSNNAVKDVGARAVGGFLLRSNTEVLNLSKNEITDGAVVQLAAGISGSKLVELNLNNNQLTSGGVNKLADAIPRAAYLKKLTVSGNGKLDKATRKKLTKALRAPKVRETPEEAIAKAKALKSMPPPSPSDEADARDLEPAAVDLVSKLVASVSGGCGGPGVPNSALLAKMDWLTNYAAVIPILRNSDASDVLLPLATGEVTAMTDADRLRAAMAIAKISGDTSEGAAMLRETGVVDLLLEQLESVVNKPEETFLGLNWDLGSVLVPILSLSTQRENSPAMEAAPDLVLQASTQLLEDGRAGDVERAVAALGHLTAGGKTPSNKMATGVFLRDVRDRANKRGSKEVDPAFVNAGMEAAGLMGELEFVGNATGENRYKQSGGTGKTDFDCMISYSWAQKPVAKHLKIQLERRGFSVNLDEHFMSSNIYERMADAIKTSKVVILCASHEYRLSPNCQREACFAADNGKKLVPVIVQDGYRPEDWLGFVIAGLLYYDLSMRDGRKFSAVVDDIVKKEFAAEREGSPAGDASPARPGQRGPRVGSRTWLSRESRFGELAFAGWIEVLRARAFVVEARAPTPGDATDFEKVTGQLAELQQP
ncbi:Dynein regulatory complex subunit 5 (T-complex-associated testis-expressed protein 1) (Tcte-1) [Durusdinium trenchii]|uniref:Dynein regulatory complex subunit 5 (T-complex-associated testis-expressed protein 1) (Tcte-1) n=1 Tax=Durusdinium trenchii TaxID=1381693 RepID=A0ABP0R4X7_9DINO